MMLHVLTALSSALDEVMMQRDGGGRDIDKPRNPMTQHEGETLKVQCII